MILFLAEFLLLTSYKSYFGAIRSAFLLFGISALIGIIGIIISFREKERVQINKKPNKLYRIIIILAISLLGIYFTSSQLYPLFSQFPLNVNDVSQSDVIPQVMTMVQNFLSGEFPYEPITKWGYKLSPNYMPLTWLPFTLAEIFQFDYRWVAYGMLVLAIILLNFFLSKRIAMDILFYLFSVSAWCILYFLIKDDPIIYTRTIENINAAYYILFAIAILSGRPLWIGIGLAACLLSRYSLVLWVPLLGLVYLLADRRALMKIIWSSAIPILLFYLIPFFLKDPAIVSRSMESYATATVEEWNPRWQAEGEKPFHLFKGIGMASFFYEKLEGSITEKLLFLKQWHLWSSIGITVLLMGFYFLFNKRINKQIFLLASLKLYMVFFYYFIQIPYTYLYNLPTFLTFILVVEIIMKTNDSAFRNLKKNVS